MKESSDLPKKERISVAKAILLGQLVVNLPVVIIILVVAGAGIALTILFRTAVGASTGWILPGIIGSVLVGAIVGWLWWSFSVPRWRKWALEHGAPGDQLQKWAVITGLIWPKGSIFEKTEFRSKE